MPFGSSLEVVRGAVRASAVHAPELAGATVAECGRPTVTISRQGGIDVSELCRHLVRRLNDRGDRGDESTQSWIAYDRNLVERVSDDNDLSRDLVESLDERDRTWFEHVTAGLSGRNTGYDVAYKVARTIRALGRMGQAIIVGRGAQAILGELPGAVHVRVVAPLDWRVAESIRKTSASPRDAERQVREIDAQRRAFVRSHFDVNVEDEALYHVVINAARVRTTTAADVIARLVTG